MIHKKFLITVIGMFKRLILVRCVVITHKTTQKVFLLSKKNLLVNYTRKTYIPSRERSLSLNLGLEDRNCTQQTLTV